MTPELLSAASHLCDVLEAENAVLAKLEFGRVGALQEEKRKALATLDGFAVEAADPSTQKDPALGARLQQLVGENRRLLEQAIVVQKRVMAVLAGAARTAQAPIGYGAKGRPPMQIGAGAIALILRA